MTLRDMVNKEEIFYSEKYQKVLMLSAVFLSSTQGIMVSASELTAVNKEKMTL